jgi:purine-binding chemotaxis protein CheW
LVLGMCDLQHLMVFSLEAQRFALPLDAVERIVRAVEVTYLPGAPEIVLGVVNIQGRVVCVVNLRKRFGLPERGPELTDQLIIARSAQRSVALLVDSVEVVERGVQTGLPLDRLMSELDGVRKIIRRDEELIFICDLDRLLAPGSATPAQGAAA